jgi:hypothetical protein
MNKKIKTSRVTLIGAIYLLLCLVALVGFFIEMYEGREMPVYFIVIPLGIAFIYAGLKSQIEDSSSEEMGIGWYRLFNIAYYINFAIFFSGIFSLVLVFLIAAGITEPRLPIYATIQEIILYVTGTFALVSIILFFIFSRHQRNCGIELHRSMKELEEFISMIKSLKIGFIGHNQNGGIWTLDRDSLLVWTTRVRAENVVNYSTPSGHIPKDPNMQVKELPIEEIINEAESRSIKKIIFNHTGQLYKDFPTVTIDELRGYLF